MLFKLAHCCWLSSQKIVFKKRRVASFLRHISLTTWLWLVPNGLGSLEVFSPLQPGWWPGYEATKSAKLNACDGVTTCATMLICQAVSYQCIKDRWYWQGTNWYNISRVCQQDKLGCQTILVARETKIWGVICHYQKYFQLLTLLNPWSQQLTCQFAHSWCILE